MAPAARKIAGGIHSPLTLLLCVIVLIVAVDSQGATNDSGLCDWTLAWVDADVEDASDSTNSRTPDDHPALCGRLCIVVFQSHSAMGRSGPADQSQGIPPRVRPRGPPCRYGPSEATSHRPLIFPGARSPRFLRTVPIPRVSVRQRAEAQAGSARLGLRRAVPHNATSELSTDAQRHSLI